MQISRILILYLILFCGVSSQVNCETFQPEIDRLFSKFCKNLTSEQLAPNSCLETSTNFYSFLMDEKFDTFGLRIVFMARAPRGQKIYKINVNDNFLSNKAVKAKNRICHAFINFDGTVFDPYYKNSPCSIEKYFKEFWSQEDHLNELWLFSIRLKDFPDFAGFSQKDATPKLMKFIPVDYKFLIENPHHLSKRKP